jgi:NosR/NirI family transcriptional regulator, nitrous oxide reductase regulator
MNIAVAAQNSWKRIALSLGAAGAFLFFWLHGPLQARPPVFEFEPHMVGFAEPVTVGEEYKPPQHGMLGTEDAHYLFGIIPTKDKEQMLYAVIGDPRSNPGLKEDVAKLVFAHARAGAENPASVKVKTGLELYFAEESDKTGKLSQLYLENTGLNKNVKGYAGPIDIGVTIGMDGAIRSVRHLRSLETTSYLTKIEKSGFYEQFKGMPLDDKSYKVNLVSGASLSTEGIANSVTQLVGIARESPLSGYLAQEPLGFEVKAVAPNTWMIDAALITALFVVAWLGIVRHSSGLSLGLSVATVAYLGFYLNNSFTYVTYTQPFLGTDWSYILAVYAALVLASAIWDGNTYCRYICPYGNVQRLLVRVIPWHGKIKVSNRVLSLVRWAIAAALVIGIGMGLRDWGSYELFPDLFGLEFLESKWFWLSVAIVLISAYYPMLWCRMLCPTGAVLDGVSDLVRSRRKTKLAVNLADIPIKVEPAAVR